MKSMILLILYEKKYLGRTFIIKLNESNGKIFVKINKKIKKEIFLNLIQVLLILSFRQKKKSILSVEKISKNLRTNFENLKSNIVPLIYPNNRILLKKPNGPKIKNTHRLRLNFRLNFMGGEIRVPILKFSKQIKNSKKTNKNLFSIRFKHQIDAAIVRIMKNKKQLSFKNLIQEVQKHIRKKFDSQVTLVKQRIDSLIKLEYIEEHSNKSNVYKYRE